MRHARFSRVLFILMASGCLLAASCQAARKNPPLFPVKTLKQELETGQVYRRIMALEALSKKETAEANELIIRAMLYDRSKPVRRAAQRELEGVEDPRIVESIFDALEAEKRDVRLAAVDVAGLVRDPDVARRLVQTAQAHPRDTELARLCLEAIRELVYTLEPAPDFERSLVPYLEHRNKKIRKTAVIILAILGRPASLEPLQKVWPRANRKLKIHLADAFANIGHREPIDVLVAALDQNYKPLLMHSLYALAQIQSFSTLPPIRELLLRHKDARVRMACLYALIEIPDEESVPVILQMLDLDDPSVLHWAIYALSQLEAVSAGPALLEKLDHPKPLVRASAAMALGELNIQAAEDKLLAIIDNGQEAGEVRIAAAKALIRLGNKNGTAVLLKELDDLDLSLQTRLAYAVTLGLTGDQAVRERLAPDIQSSKFTRALTAALVLGLMGDAGGRSTLVTALEHGYPSIRKFAIMGLEGILDAASLKALADTANDDRDPLVRILCAASLVRAGYPDFRVILWNALDTRQEDQRAEAIIALGGSANPMVMEQLKWYLKREPSIPVRQTIQRVFRDWKKKNRAQAQ